MSAWRGLSSPLHVAIEQAIAKAGDDLRQDQLVLKTRNAGPPMRGGWGGRRGEEGGSDYDWKELLLTVLSCCESKFEWWLALVPARPPLNVIM